MNTYASKEILMSLVCAWSFGASAQVGTPYKPIKIKTLSDFNLIRQDPYVDYELAANIDATGKTFEPIEVLYGTFNGNSDLGYSITNLTETGPNLGLFKTLKPSAVVENLNLNINFVPKTTTTFKYGTTLIAGGIAANSQGTILSCTVSGSISASVQLTNDNFYQAEVGGIAGTLFTQANFANIGDSTSSVSIHLSVTNPTGHNVSQLEVDAGGVVGRGGDDSVFATTDSSVISSSIINYGTHNFGSDPVPVPLGNFLGGITWKDTVNSTYYACYNYGGNKSSSANITSQVSDYTDKDFSSHSVDHHQQIGSFDCSQED